MGVRRRSNNTSQYSLNTEGWNAQGFFSPNSPKAYSSKATLQELVYADPVTLGGTIGIYNATGALVSGSVPATGVIHSIVQKNSDDSIKRSTELVSGQYTVTKTDYDAPVLQQDYVGFNGTDGSLNINIVGGLQEFVLSVRETTPANQPFPVMEGRAIVRSGTPSEYAVANKIVTDITNNYDFERNGDNAFAAVSVVSDVTGTVAALGATYIFTDGSNQVFASGTVIAEAVAGSYLVNKDFSPGEIFKVVSSSFDGTNTSIVLDRSFSGADPGTKTTAIANIFYANEADVNAAKTGISIIGKNAGVHFDTSASEDLGDADISNTVDWKFGSGAAWQVASIEDETTVFDGDTTGNAAFHEDYGTPDLWVNHLSTTDHYQLYIIESLNRILPSAGAPQNQTLMVSNIVIAAIVGSDLETQLDLIFGT